MKGRWPFRLLLAAAGLVWLAMTFWTFPELRRLSGGLEPFDLRLTGYGAADTMSYLDALGAEGRQYYLTVQQRLDWAFPALLALSLLGALARLVSGPVLWLLSAAALAGAGFDYLENAAVRDMLIRGAAGDVAMAASRWTVLKGLGFGLATAGLVLLLLRAGWQRIRG